MNTRYWKLVINGSAGVNMMRILNLATFLALMALAVFALVREQSSLALLALVVATALCGVWHLETRESRLPRPPPPYRED
jgi:hypothetical protein